MLKMPPPDLRFNVAGTEDAAVFDALGQLSVQDFTRAMAGVGRDFTAFTRLLEWGCGCGRILRHIPFDHRYQEVHGCDIDPKGIRWLQEAFPALRVRHTEGLPPLPYEDGQFDLIINHSVLSHLDEAYQDAWLDELKRILSPDGTLILTVHGDHAYRCWLATLPPEGEMRAQAIAKAEAALDARGIYFLVDDGWAANFPAYYQSTFHRPGYVFTHWTKWFDILSYTPQGALGHQDMVVLRHKR